MKRPTLLFIFFVLLSTALACNMPQGSAEPTADVAVVVAQTQTAIAVQQFLTATVAPQQDIPVVPTATPPTDPGTSPVPSNTPTATALPPTVTNPPNCNDKAEFISETIPDETAFNPGTPFTKSWTLRNAGSCTWTTGYSLVLVQGEAMAGPATLFFSQTVTPGGSMQLNLPQVAPSDPGEHAGYWKLRNARGQDFGNLWVKITVSGGGSSGGQNLGSPTWIESFSDGTASFSLGSDSSTNFEVDDGNLILTAYSSQGDQWRISSKGYPEDFHLEARFQTGQPCSGKDSYGLIVRAPDQPNSIIDTGYVFVFSCEGKYRVYRMDNGQFASIQNWTASSSLKSGADKSNVMGIRAKGEKFELYANGAKIFEFTDGAYLAGYFGLVIRSEVTSNFQVLLSEISFWDLSN